MFSIVFINVFSVFFFDDVIVYVVEDIIKWFGEVKKFIIFVDVCVGRFGMVIEVRKLVDVCGIWFFESECFFFFIVIILLIDCSVNG